MRRKAHYDPVIVNTHIRVMIFAVCDEGERVDEGDGTVIIVESECARQCMSVMT